VNVYAQSPPAELADLGYRHVFAQLYQVRRVWPARVWPPQPPADRPCPAAVRAARPADPE
jgi:hypothetical protein